MIKGEWMVFCLSCGKFRSVENIVQRKPRIKCSVCSSKSAEAKKHEKKSGRGRKKTKDPVLYYNRVLKPLLNRDHVSGEVSQEIL